MHDQNIKINYPQISNYNDSRKQQTINNLIKTSVLKVLEDYQDDLSSLDMNIDYEIKYQGADLLSIEYLGLATVKGTAHPVNAIWTTNIDLEKKQELALGAVVNINDSLVEKFKEGQYKAYSADLHIKSAGALPDVLDGFSSQDLLEFFKEQSRKFYFTKDSLGISVEVGHAVGDHLEMEMPYTALGELLLLKPQGSADLSSNDTMNTSVGGTAVAPPDSEANSEITKEKAADILTDYLQTIGISKDEDTNLVIALDRTDEAAGKNIMCFRHLTI
jgi:hypothetical protein